MTEVYTPEEVASRWKCSPSFVRRMVADGKMPGAFRLGGKLLRIPHETVEAIECQNTDSSGSEAAGQSQNIEMENGSPVTSLRAAMRHRRLMNSGPS
jgi:excisionase family DNA binding protein